MAKNTNPRLPDLDFEKLNVESTPITTHFSSVHLPAAAKTLEFS